MAKLILQLHHPTPGLSKRRQWGSRGGVKIFEKSFTRIELGDFFPPLPQAKRPFRWTSWRESWYLQAGEMGAYVPAFWAVEACQPTPAATTVACYLEFRGQGDCPLPPTWSSPWCLGECGRLAVFAVTLLAVGRVSRLSIGQMSHLKEPHLWSKEESQHRAWRCSKKSAGEGTGLH